MMSDLGQSAWLISTMLVTTAAIWVIVGYTLSSAKKDNKDE